MTGDEGPGPDVHTGEPGVKRLERQLADAQAGNRSRIAELQAKCEQAKVNFQADFTIPALVERIDALAVEVGGEAAALRVKLRVEDWLAEQWDRLLTEADEKIAEADSARARAVLLQPGQVPPPPNGSTLHS